MAIKEQNALFRGKDADGNSVLVYPITKAENVDGLEDMFMTDEDTMDMLSELGAVQPVTSSSGAVLIDSTGVIYSL